jgi:zinc finger protein
VEGCILRAVELEALQDERKVNLGACILSYLISTEPPKMIIIFLLLQKVDPQKAEALDYFLVKLRSLGSGEAAFTFVLDDPAGNSFNENP